MTDTPSFEEELERLINKHSKEGESDTPDFILAKFLRRCLTVFAQTTREREVWYGRKPPPTIRSKK